MKLEQLSLGPDDPQPRQPLEGQQNLSVQSLLQQGPVMSRVQMGDSIAPIV